MVVLGKGLGGGIFPLAALVVREEFDVAPERALGHYTHEKNPVACAAALAAIEVIESEGLLGNAQTLGAQAMDRMRGMQHRHACVLDVRGLGLLLGIELDAGGAGESSDLAEQMMYAALQRGLSFKLSMGCILTLTPPLTVSVQEMTQAFDILDTCFSELATS